MAQRLFDARFFIIARRDDDDGAAMMTTEQRMGFRMAGNSSHAGKRRTQRKCQSAAMVMAAKNAAMASKLMVVHMDLRNPAGGESPKFVNRKRQTFEELSNLRFIPIRLRFRRGLDEGPRILHSADDALHL